MTRSRATAARDARGLRALRQAGPGTAAWGLTAAELVPIAQATSERMPLAVAVLVGVAVLTVLARLLILLVRKEGQGQPEASSRPAEAAQPDRRLWGAGAANGAVDGEAGRDDDPAGRADRRSSGEEQREPPRPVVRPPQPREAWTAEIAWATDGARFRVLARRGDHPDTAPVVLAQTEPLPWPPTDEASVQALTDASAALEAVLLDSGWSALPGGEAWYAKRFAWEPVAADGRRGSGRFARNGAVAPDPVPQDAEPRH